MPKILILNMGTEHALIHELVSTHSLVKSTWRHTWFAAESDIIISPAGIQEDLLRYVGDTLGFDSESVQVVNCGQLVTDDLLQSTDLLDELRLRMIAPGPWEIMPCFHTKGVAELEFLIRTGDGAELAFAAQYGSDLLNRKSHFRRLAAGAHVPIAEGSIAHSPRALAKAIEQHLPATGTVIVKRDNAAGGMGNVTLTRGTATPLPGSRETLHTHGDLQRDSHLLWEQLTDRLNQVLVVEAYHAASHRFYFEYLVDGSRPPCFLNSGTIRLRPDSDPDAKELVWVGLDIPAELPAFSSAIALTWSAQLATLAGRIGYRGHINIDAILTESGEVIFNETNARWGGGLVLHAIGERLLGAMYANAHVLSSIKDVRSPPRPEVLRTLRERGLHYSPRSREGVVLLACDDLLSTAMECLLIGPSRSHVRQTESLLREALEQ